ncbi:MAG: hypothetical protein RL350_1072 [Pseudomonadota bacterium]
MYFPYQKLIHWLTTLAFIFGALAPTMTHAVSMPTNGSTLVMEVCMADGTKQVLDLNTEDAITLTSVDCLYCVAQAVGLPNLLSNQPFNACIDPKPLSRVCKDTLCMGQASLSGTTSEYSHLSSMAGLCCP